MLKNLKKKSQGFTIIEVLIVLAIAGLIMLIVFLAVPALQRNSRNTQRKNDISALLGAVTEYNNNNQGAFPADGAFNTVFTNTNVKLGYYDAASVTWNAEAGAHAQTDPDDLDKVTVTNYSKCSGNDSVTTGATQRSIVAVYTIEGSGGSHVKQCQEG